MASDSRQEYVDKCVLCASPDVTTIDQTAQVCRCAHCGLLFDNPRPTPAAIADFHSSNDKYDGWLHDIDKRQVLWNNRLAKLTGKVAHGALLDVGTGIGQFLHQASSSFASVTGTEVSRSGVAIAKEKYGLDVRLGEITNMEFGDEKFDVVTMFHVLEHVHYPSAVLDKCISLLNPGGSLLIAVPNDVQPFRIFLKQLLKRLGRKKFAGIGPTGLPRLDLDGSIGELHLLHFRFDVLKNALKERGLTIVDSSLDRYYVASGLKKIIKDAHYAAFMAFYKLTGINLYPSLWVIAKKSA